MDKVGLGVVIQNNQGQAIASLSEQIPLSFSLDVVEALATARAISFARELGCSSFILEGDSDVVIKTLVSEEESLSPFGHILASTKANTNASFSIIFTHVRRIGNSIKHVRRVRGFSVWIEMFFHTFILYS